VQTIKAGIMEIADIFVINKSDLPGAETVQRELEAMLSLTDGRKPPIVRTVARDGTGVVELLAAIEARSLTVAVPCGAGAKNRDREGAGVVVTLRVLDLDTAIESLRAAGARLLGQPPDAAGHRRVLLDPGGILLELIQENPT
jgi:putative protein kinase ArgK-like GTPase of G3E family